MKTKHVLFYVVRAEGYSGHVGDVWSGGPKWGLSVVGTLAQAYGFFNFQEAHDVAEYASTHRSCTCVCVDAAYDDGTVAPVAVVPSFGAVAYSLGPPVGKTRLGKPVYSGVGVKVPAEVPHPFVSSKVPTPKVEGYICAECNGYNTCVEPNQPNGTYVCFECRT